MTLAINTRVSILQQYQPRGLDNVLQKVMEETIIKLKDICGGSAEIRESTLFPHRKNYIHKQLFIVLIK